MVDSLVVSLVVVSPPTRPLLLLLLLLPPARLPVSVRKTPIPTKMVDSLVVSLVVVVVSPPTRPLLLLLLLLLLLHLLPPFPVPRPTNPSRTSPSPVLPRVPNPRKLPRPLLTPFPLQALAQRSPQRSPLEAAPHRLVLLLLPVPLQLPERVP